MESAFAFKFVSGARGKLAFTVRISTDHLDQSHSFTYDIDLSCLVAAIRDCQSILDAYPIRDKRKT